MLGVALLALVLGPLPGTAQPPGGGAPGAGRETPAVRGLLMWRFDRAPLGGLPAGWKVEATRGKGPLATWRIVADSTVGDGRVLALVRTNHHSGGTFNLCWTDSVRFLDGRIQVRFKAVSGEEDQGGGVLWRALDRNNYYIARFNPLEDNFRLYRVHQGRRRMLASARARIPAGEWHTLAVVQQGSRYEGYLDGRRLLSGTDSTFTEPGGVGLWTKADAVTSFDDFRVEPRVQASPGEEGQP